MVLKIAFIFKVLLFCYLVVGLLLFFYQNKFLYHPTEKIKHNFEVKSFSIENEKIEVIVVNEGRDRALLYFGGNGEAVAFNAKNFVETFPEHTVYLVNYRGYGGSSGEPEEQVLYLDAQTIFKKLEQKHAAISVVGRSLGSGIATMLAANNKVDKLVLITPYDSIERVAQNRFPIYPMSFLLKDKYDSISRVKDISAQTLILIASNDGVIPFENSVRLSKAFPPLQIEIEVIKNTGHNSISATQQYYSLLHTFLSASS